MKKIDKYIIRKFLGTFFYSLALIISISIIFDVSEKIDDFIDKDAPIGAIVFDYYLNFIPYFINLFSPLFVFIAVVFFTSKMASDTEVVAILSSGVSFKRFMYPYFISALVLAIMSLVLNNYIIPLANAKRVTFENKYIKNVYYNGELNIHRQISPGVFIYFEQYNNSTNVGSKFSLEKVKDNELYYKITSDLVQWDTIKKKWRVENYAIRTIDGMNETLTRGLALDTMLGFEVREFAERPPDEETMTLTELNKFIDVQRMKGSDEIPYYLIEKYRRFAFPFATFVLTLIGVTLASRKVRGGIGMHIGLGILISFTYILFMQVSVTFATNGNMSPLLAVWLPNIIFIFVGIYLYRIAPK